MGNATKSTWKQETMQLLESCIQNALQIRITTMNMEFIILKSPLSEDSRISSCSSYTYKEKQDYIFFKLETSDTNVTQIGVYQKHMSLNNFDKSICFTEKSPINELDDEKLWYYKNAIVNFLMANIVWK